ncbi:uncharacterized protein LOC124662430 [Lolium rigidum]|uniref:uncharacterized protein LOC124662430 n=1 Tax=Lolium rigidum TaxID=89674 RepID=UPI001F5CBEBD|nr:uncharacterized protein LOC124662430 [Lolium rigidum]
MTSQPAIMAEDAIAGVMPLLPGIPDELAIWEILIRLPPKSLLRCRAVCRAWRRATSIRAFLLAHHDRQASLPIVWGKLVSGSEHGGARYKDFLAFNQRATDAQLQPVARLDQSYSLRAICDGLLILSNYKSDTYYRICFSICNPVTRQSAPLRQPSGFILLGMYLHRPTGEYRLLLGRRTYGVSPILGSVMGKGEISCYVFVLGSDQPPRYIQRLDPESGLCFLTPTLVRDSLHWFSLQHQSQSRRIIVFDTTAELFRQMRAPLLPTSSCIFEMDGTLGIYSHKDDMKVVDIWVLQNYEGEIWECKYRVELPVDEIIGLFGRREGHWDVTAVTADGDILLLLSHGHWLFYVDIDGKLVDSFHRDGQYLSPCGLRLKQTLVPHTFFTALEDHVVNASPFI